MDCTPNAKAIEELSERIAEQMKGIVQRLGEEARKEERTLEWFEKQVLMVLKGIGQTLVAGLCELYVSAYYYSARSGSSTARRASLVLRCER